MAALHPLLIACTQGNYEQAKKIVDKSSSSLQARDSEGRAPLQIASAEGHEEIVKLLLGNKHVDINAVDKEGWNCLHAATSRGHIVICELLLQRGVDAQALTKQGTSAFHYAVRSHFNSPFHLLSTLELLLKGKANINQENLYGETPLHQAAFRGNELAVVWLLKNGSDINFISKKKMTPLNMAVMVGHKGVVEILISRGANVTLAPSDPKEMAKSTKNPIIMKLFDDAIDSPPESYPTKCEVWDENEAVIENFLECKQQGANHFSGPLRYIPVKLGTVNKVLKVDFSQSPSELLEFFQQKFNLPDMSQYCVFVQLPNHQVISLELEVPITTQLEKEGKDPLPPASFIELKRRRRYFDPKLTVVSCLCRMVDILEVDPVAKALVVVFEASGRSASLLRWAVRSELSTTQNGAGLFREDSIWSKTIAHYLKLIGAPYLNKMLAPLIRSMSASQETFELDPNRPDWKKTTMKRMKKLVETFVNIICKSIDITPLQIIKLCVEIKHEVNQKFNKDEVVISTLSGFMFLRFICPAITSPNTSGILDEPPSPEARRGLVLIAKILQGIANGVEFGDKESFLAPLNKFVLDKNKDIKEFLSQLCQEPIPSQIQPIFVRITEDQELEAFTNLEKQIEAMEGNPQMAAKKEMWEYRSNSLSSLRNNRSSSFVNFL